MKPAIEVAGATEQRDAGARRAHQTGVREGPKPLAAGQPAVRLHLRAKSALLASKSDGETADLSQSNLVPTVFHEDWWLEAATGGSYTIAEATANGRIVGRLPFMVRRRFGIHGIWTPPLTHFLGPGIDDGNGSENTRLHRRLEITKELIRKLPRSSWQCIRCHGGIPDVIAFQELSFKTYAQFTHEIASGQAQELWQKMRDKTRNVIRKAEEQFTVTEIHDAEEFIRVYEAHLCSRRVRNTLDLSAARRLLQGALERNRGRIVAAHNAQKEIVAANFCAWDARASFYVACTRGADAGNGASSLLLWDAIQHAAASGLIFDFAGMGTRGSVLHYSGFGATISTRFVAVRATGIGRLVARSRVLFMDEHFLY
jgi:hypothetical protein